jgi:uncharacterized OB-fold protein
MEMLDLTGVGFYEAMQEKILRASHCEDCGDVQCPPRTICPNCWSSKVSGIEMSGKGVLRTYTIVNIGLTQMIEAGYDRFNPYCAGLVELEEGPVVSAQILGVDVSQPELIKIGTPLQAVFVERGKDDAAKTFLGFEPS